MSAARIGSSLYTSHYRPRDGFFRRARAQGYRSRAAYKLLDLLRRVPEIGRGSAVVDLGCWPGGWLQVLAQRVGPGGRVVGVDLRPVEPLGESVVLLQLDFREAGVEARVAEALGRPATAILCDAAPRLSGVADVDRAALQEIHEAALLISRAVLRPDGALVLKGFPGPETAELQAQLRRSFRRVSERRPEGKRPGSKEFYWIAEGLVSGF